MQYAVKLLKKELRRLERVKLPSATLTAEKDKKISDIKVALFELTGIVY